MHRSVGGVASHKNKETKRNLGRDWTDLVHPTLSSRGHNTVNVHFGLHVSGVEGHINMGQTLRRY